MKIQQTTLLMILRGNQILLAEKKRGFGVGKINGVGGKVERGETIEQAMIRETQEEIGVTPINFTKMAIVTFDEWMNGERKLIVTNVYTATDYIGKIIETDEMKPKWFKLNEIPYNEMFEDDKIWLPEILKGNKLTAEFVYDKDFNMISYKMDVENAPQL